MGGGRKTETIVFNEISNSTTANGRVSSRNLYKDDLGGVIFGCKHSTMKECLSNQIFGLPGPHIAYVKNIYPGFPLFLFNYSDRKMHGIYEATSNGRMNINPYGWSADEAEETQYPAQAFQYLSTMALWSIICFFDVEWVVENGTFSCKGGDSKCILLSSAITLEELVCKIHAILKATEDDYNIIMKVDYSWNGCGSKPLTCIIDNSDV